MGEIIVYLIGFLLSLNGLSESVKIVELRVPGTVHNGTVEPTILDCDYILEDGEKKKEIVVKWFFNRSPTPVYQWIFGQAPTPLGILRNRLDLTFSATDEDWGAHRALSIIRPSTELTGDWLCRVSTFKNDAMRTSRMIVYAPPKEMDITLVSGPTPNSINISCWATGVFPEPKLTITYGSYQLEDVITDVSWNDGAFDIVVHKMVEDGDLSSPLPVIFDCELKIPNTSYVHRKNLLYAGRPEELTSSATSLFHTSSPSSGVFGFLILIMHFFYHA